MQALGCWQGKAAGQGRAGQQGSAAGPRSAPASKLERVLSSRLARYAGGSSAEERRCSEP